MWTWSGACASGFPPIRLMVDANSAYTLADADHLRQLDEFYLMMIEQPLSHDEIIDHAELQAKLATPICLDECIRTRASCRAGHPPARLRHHQYQAGPRGRLPRGEARSRCRAGRGHSRVVRRHAGGRHRARAQHRAFDAAEFHAAGRCLGQQALLEARHHSARRRDHAARDHRRARRARLRLSRSTSISSARITVREESHRLNAFVSLLRENRNYRYTWIGQVVSEVGDHFNNIAVFSLAVAATKSPTGGERRLACPRGSGMLARSAGGRAARPLRPQARDDRERSDPHGGGGRFHLHRASSRRRGCSIC